MSEATALNDRVVEATASATLLNLGTAPAVSLATLYQGLAHTTVLLYAGAVGAQQQQAILGQAAANEGLVQLYSVGTMAGAVATARLAESGRPAGASLASLVSLARCLG